MKRYLFSHMKLIKHLRVHEPADFRNYLRMDDNTFKLLVELVRPKISKQTTIMRDPVSVEERLSVTLRYLATGSSYEDLKFTTAISAQCIGRVVPETYWAIYEALKRKYLKVSYDEV